MLRAVLALAIATAQAATEPPLALELRVFNGPDDVTRESRLTLYRAGDRSEPIARSTAVTSCCTFPVEAGFYDVQAVRERDGRVLAIRWAERLVVMAYPDEGGRHLEVINLQEGFGALQVRDTRGAGAPDVALYAAGDRDKEAGPRFAGEGYALFVVRAASYDLKVRGARPSWQTRVEVPADRTRLWFVDSGR
jgi:hypothetical protein